MSKNKLFVEFGSNSWIRSWFMRQDDWTLWCIGVVWVVSQILVATAIITTILKALAS